MTGRAAEMFDIKENLKKLPACPGVYMHKDALGNIIYVGKAVNLKNRVSQYFQKSRDMGPKVRSMVSNIAEFEYITVAGEMEALILECNLIKKYRPKYNILLRDDKTYPYIKVTGEKYPRIIKTRNHERDGGKYYGPYSDAGAVNRITDLLNSAFALKRCSAQSFPEGFRPCLNFHIGQCMGVCTGRVSEEEYGRALEGAVDFLNGHTAAVTSELKEKMNRASEELRYEDAASYRDCLEAVKSLSETQRVVLHHDDEGDILIPAMAGETMHIIMFSLREGKLVGREVFDLDGEDYGDEDREEAVSAFIKQYYSSALFIPREIILRRLPEDRELLEKYLTELAGRSVRIIRPERGEKKALLELASKDVVEMVKTLEERAAAGAERKRGLREEIESVLGSMGVTDRASEDRDYRVEAYDISNINGVDTVGAMVVFDGLKPDRKSYRKFKVRNAAARDDYGAMKEVLSRRFLRLLNGDDSFSQLPDMILMDGGKGHVAVALEVIEASGLDVPVAGMVKDDRHRTRGLVYRKKGEWEEIPLREKPLLFRYTGRIQEEVHRFAIEYHSSLRGKNAVKSALDEIRGIGPVRRQALLRKFGSIEEIRKVVKEEPERILELPEMDSKALENMKIYFDA